MLGARHRRVDCSNKFYRCLAPWLNRRVMEKKDWREINDIVRVQGFCWLANGKDSCWMKMRA